MWVFWDVMLSCWVFPDISSECTTITIRIKQPKTLKARKSFQMLGITCSVIQCHIQQDLHLQQQCCEILKFHRHLFSPKPNQSPTQWEVEALSAGFKQWCMKLTTHLHPVPWLSMHETTYTLPHIFPAWCLIKHRKNPDRNEFVELWATRWG